MQGEDTRRLEIPTEPCPHCGATDFLFWIKPKNPDEQTITCNECGAVMSSTYPLDPDDRPKRELPAAKNGEAKP